MVKMAGKHRKTKILTRPAKQKLFGKMNW